MARRIAEFQGDLAEKNRSASSVFSRKYAKVVVKIF